MLKRLKKYLKIPKYRKSLDSDLSIILHKENLDKILNGYKINKLPEIQISELLQFYSLKTENNIEIKTDFSGGISPVNDYFFLCLIAKGMDLKSYFEFGTWIGLSAYNIARNMDHEIEICSLDIPFDHPEISLFNFPAENFGFFAKDLKNIQFLKSDSKNFDYVPYRRKFDFVFIDGNHTHDYVVNDTKIALELIKDDNSVIAWHDYILCSDLNKEVLSGILDGIPAENHKHIYSIYQSNLAIYSKSFNFEKKYFKQWNIPEVKFTIIPKITNK